MPWRKGSQAQAAVSGAVVELCCCLMLGAGQQKESSPHAGGRMVARLLGKSRCLARRGRGDASAREPDASPSLLGCAVLPAQLSAAAAELGLSDAGGLLRLGCAAGIHRGGIPPPKTFRSTLGQLEA